jgi:predicted RNase H-like nuclease (RuvC/YqgF family)
MSVPPPPVPRKYIPKNAPGGVAAAAGVEVKDAAAAKAIQEPSRSKSERESEGAPAARTSSGPKVSTASRPEALVAPTRDETANLKLTIAELLRENEMLQKRLASFLQEGVAEGESAELCLYDNMPVSMLIARIKRLEMALALEAVERDELETRVTAQGRVIARLQAQLPAPGASTH